MTTSPPRRFPLIPVLIGLGVIALVVTVLLSMGSTSPSGEEFGSPTISGLSLPRGGTEPDTAVGMAIPEVVGADFGGNEVRIAQDGRAKILIFLAHWCPHCQAEVPVVTEWLDAGNLPDNVDLIAIATSTSSTRVNFPPSAWLAEESFEAPTIVDDEAYSVGNAYGINAFPFWVFVSPEGLVVARTSGELTPDVITDIATTLAAMQPAG